MKALTVGGAMQDSIAIIANEKIEQVVMRNADASFLMLEEGKKTEADEISTHCGGGAINAAVSMARIGLDVASLAKVGKDYKARTILDKLEQEGISQKWITQVDNAPTGSSVIIASHDRDAAIFTFRGANTLLLPEELKDEAFEVDLLYVSSLSNESADCFPLLVEKGKANNAFVATNPGIRQLSSRALAFHTSLQNIDLLSINKREGEAMLPQLIASDGAGGAALATTDEEDLPDLIHTGLRSEAGEMSLAHFVNTLMDKGVNYVVITAGGKGSFLACDEQLHFCPALPDVEVAGTAGGGDAYASTLTAYLCLGRDPHEAMQAAALNAASVIGYSDTQTGLLKFEDLEKQLANTKHHLNIRSWKL